MENKYSKTVNGKARTCAQCKKCYEGEGSTIGAAEADYYVSGVAYNSVGNLRAYHGYLCIAHLDAMQTDGAQFKEITELGETPTLKKTIPTKTQNIPANSEMGLDIITRKYTGYDNFDHLCRGNPTLMIDKDDSEEKAEELKILIKSWKWRRATRTQF